jgi:hypothetical protein
MNRQHLASACALALLASSAPSQNLLTRNGWQPWNAQYVTQYSATQTSITFAPYAPGIQPGLEVCGVEQQLTVPTTGVYQLKMVGVGGKTGTFPASWQIQGQSFGFRSDLQQHTWTVALTAGPATLRLETPTSNLMGETWLLKQPELLPATAPTADVELVANPTGPPKAVFTSEAAYVVVGLETWAPLHIPGILGTLDTNPIMALPAPVSFDPAMLTGVAWPAFYLQALALTPSPRLGSLLTVQPWSF